MTRSLTDDQIGEVVSFLMGSCCDIEEAMPEGVALDDLTAEDLAAIDDQVLQCDVCGWWVESGFINDNGVCDECQEEDGEG